MLRVLFTSCIASMKLYGIVIVKKINRKITNKYKRNYRGKVTLERGVFL